ncbi:MAG TPA: hypothetical protein VEQ60_00320 [Longimicrobium sp.]|nr:hypothetical protein [Longimicrobium sp.]
MKYLIRILMAMVLAIVLFVAAGLARNYVQAETRGTVPLQRLAHRGSGLDRSIARALTDSLKTRPFPREWDWYVRRERSANGDSIRFRIYRGQDARVLGRMFTPDPHIAGGAVYLVRERRFASIGIGIR